MILRKKQCGILFCWVFLPHSFSPDTSSEAVAVWNPSDDVEKWAGKRCPVDGCCGFVVMSVNRRNNHLYWCCCNNDPNNFHNTKAQCEWSYNKAKLDPQRKATLISSLNNEESFLHHLNQSEQCLKLVWFYQGFEIGSSA